MGKLLERLSEGMVTRNLREESHSLVKKWTQTGLLEGLKDDWTKRNLSILLENQTARLIKEATTMSGGDVEGYASSAFPMVRRVFGELLANKIVSVQAINQPTSLIFYIDFQYTNTRLNKVAGDSVYGGQRVGRELTTSGGVDLSGFAAADSGFYNLMNGYTSPTASAVALTITAMTSGTYGASEGLNRGVKFDPDFTSGTTVFAIGKFARADVETGGNYMNFDNMVALVLHTGSVPAGGALPTGSQVKRLTQWSGSTKTHVQVTVASEDGTTTAAQLMTFLTGGTIKATFPIRDVFANVGDTALGAVVGSTNWGLENQTVIPEIDLKVDSVDVRAVTKKLKYKWTQEVAQDLNAWQNLDAESELTQVASELIQLEIDREILEDLMQNAKAGTFYWSASPGLFVDKLTGAEVGASAKAPDFTGTVSEWYQTLLDTLNLLSAQIQRKTLRGGGTYVVCGPEIAGILEGTAGWRASVTNDEASGTAGVQSPGTISKKWDVHVLADFPRQLILMGRKGKSVLETGYVYAPYVPLEFTPVFFDPESGVPRKMVMTRYAKKMIRSDFFGVVVVRGLFGESGA